MPDITPPNTPSNAVTFDDLVDSFPMTTDHNKVPTEFAARMGDMEVYTATRNVSYIGTDTVYDAIGYSNTAVTDSAGNAIFYLTDTRTASGNALYSSVYEKTIAPIPYGPGLNYQVKSWTVSSDKKSVTVAVNQLNNVAGLLSIAAAAAGVSVNLTLIGK